MVGMTQKPRELLAGRQRNRVSRRYELAPVAPEPPELPADYPASVKQAWADLFAGDIGRAIDLKADLPLLMQWASAMVEVERVRQRIAETDDPKLLASLATREGVLLRAILAISDRFGMSPLARFRLQITGVEAQKSIRSLTREVEEEHEVIELNEDEYPAPEPEAGPHRGA